MSQDLLEALKDGVAVLTLNRPDRLNAMSPSMLDALPPVTRARMATTAAQNAVAFFQGRRPPNMLNPETFKNG